MSSVLQPDPPAKSGAVGGQARLGRGDATPTADNTTTKTSREQKRPSQLAIQLEIDDGVIAASGGDDALAGQGAGLGSGPRRRPAPARVYITGWRLYAISFSLCLSLLLSTLETTIVSTSLVSISNALGGFEQRDWVVTSYLLTYTGFLVIYAKFSDILGRKLMLLVALSLFTIFSIVCGSISSMLHLIVFRAFQGIGASGIYAIVTVVNPELVPPERWGSYISVVAIVFVLSSILGPILGGAINNNASWRWVFLLNGPTGALATALIAFLLPTHFPHQGDPSRHVRLREKFRSASLARLDIPGAVLLLAFSILLVFGFEEAGSRYAWSSAVVVSTLALGAVSLAAFVGWEGVVAGARIGLLTGPPFMAALINLPQRFQAVHGSSPLQAGIHMMPMLLCSPVATVLAGQLTTRLGIPPFYLMLAGATLQVLGIGLASSAGLEDGAKMYGYEVIMGFAFGITLVTLMFYVPLTVRNEDMAVAMGAVTQIRVLDGTIGLAISSAVLGHYVSPRLAKLLDRSEIARISDSIQAISELPDSTRDTVREVFSEGYSAQLRAMLYFSAVVWVVTLLLWEKKLKRARDWEG